MCPVSVGTSRSIHALETGEAKLWSLLVGVNQYGDENLPSLRYPAFDCQGLGEALIEATQGFPRKEVIIHHDFAAVAPKLETVRASLQQIVAAARPEDTILIYFSGHGVLDINTQQVFLCLTDSNKEDLSHTGLSLPELLQLLGNSTVHRQMIWLDACHSGDMSLRGAKGEAVDRPILNPTRQLVEVLRQRAAQSKGFYALLSCDQNQRSWEFPDLEHGLFTYYLMQGLRGEAADAQGVIDADGLYKYVYHQTLQYIDKTNQKLRLMNQQKRSRGETDLHPEYPLQTPKRIVEGVGELVLGLKPDTSIPTGNTFVPQRRALFIDGLSSSKTTLELSKVLREAGGFELDYWPQTGKMWSEVRMAVRTCLRWPIHSVVNKESSEQSTSNKEPVVVLLYLRGILEEIEDGEAWLVLGDNIRLSRSWLQQELRRAAGMVQQIIILDCPGASSISNWVEELKLGSQYGQCIIAAASATQQPEQFSQALLETLVTTNQPVGLPVADWITKLQVKLERIKLPLHVWLSGLDGVIEVLPNGSWFSSDLQSSNSASRLHNAIKVLPSGNKPVVQPEQKLESADANKIKVAAQVESSQHLSDHFQEQYSQMEVMLKELIGPIASTLLRQVAAKASSPQAGVQDLMQHLTPLQQIELEKWSTVLFSKSTVQPQTKSSIHAPSLKHQGIPEDFMRECEQALANFIGPIATFLVQKTLKSHPQISPTELAEILAVEIPDSQKAIEFRQQLSYLR